MQFACMIAQIASPMAFVPVAQAVTTARFGPRMPISIATVPPAVSGSIIGIRNGLSRDSPRSARTPNCSETVPIPPIPDRQPDWRAGAAAAEALGLGRLAGRLEDAASS